MQHEWGWLPTQTSFLSPKYEEKEHLEARNPHFHAPFPRGAVSVGKLAFPCPASPSPQQQQPALVHCQAKFKITKFHVFICFLQQKSEQNSHQGKLKIKLQLRVCMQGKMLTWLEMKRYHRLSAHILRAPTVLNDSQSQPHSEPDISKLYTE